MSGNTASTKDRHHEADRWYFLLLFLSLLAYVAFRAGLVPWVHDESTSLYWFLEREQFLPYVALWDAGNHFLSSAIGALGHKLWGLSLFGSRVGSVLAFPLYAWAVYRLGAGLHERRIRWAAWLALLGCPFLLDFFSLFRGYGLGMAFWAVALDGGLRYHAHQRTRHLLQLLAALALANFAVLSLVPVWAFIMAALAVHFVLHRKRTGSLPPTRDLAAWVLLGVLPLMLGLLLSWEMRRRGLLYHGATDGFIPVTLASLCRYVLGNAHMAVCALAAIAVAAATLVVPLRSLWKRPLAWVALVLWADVCMRIGMAWLLDVNYPEDRAALYLVPLAILLVAMAVDALPAEQRLPRRLALLALWFLPARLLYTANVDHTLLWPEQSTPTRFLSYVATMQKGKQRPMIIGAYHQLGMAIPYAARLHGIALDPPDVDGFPEGPHDVRIVDARFLEQASVGWREVDHAPGPGLHLLVPERRLRTAIFARKSFAAPDPTAEFVEVWRGDTVPGDMEVLVQLRCHISSEADFLDLRLVASADREGGQLFYRDRPLPLIRPHWQGEELHTVVRLPATPGATGRVVYFWNPGRVPVTIVPGEVKLHRTNVLPSH
jgi:hypothetical protein